MPVSSQLEKIVAPALAAGRSTLFEPEAFRVLEILGFRIPRGIEVPLGQLPEPGWLEGLPGDRVVLKAIADGLLHKSDRGGVSIVPRRTDALREAIGEQERSLGDHGLRAFYLQEYVPHGQALGHELIASLRWTEEYGPVLSLGPGGLHAETLGQLPDATVLLAPFLDDERTRRRALRNRALTSILLDGARGQPPLIPVEGLAALIDRLIAVSRHFPHHLEELEINPLVCRSGELVALDALVKLGGDRDAPPAPRPLHRLDRLLRPNRVGVLGVSRRLNPGRIVVQNLLEQGFPRDRIVIVKPGETEIDGCRCYPELASVPGSLDLLVLALGAAEIPSVVEEVVRTQKAESLIVIPGGMGELGGSEGHVSSVRDVLRASRETSWGGPIVNGGNCLGVRSRPGRIDTLFIPRHKLPFPGGPETPLALVSQSGALTVARASTLWNLEPRYLVSVGNQIDLTVGDYLEHLADDPEVQVFACYVEGFRPGDGHRWLQAARRITDQGRVVILYRAGRSREGRAATASHTASLAGPYEITRELARLAGALVAETLADFADLIRLACGLRDRPPRGRRLAALSNAGFECVAQADRLGSLKLAELHPKTAEQLGELLRRCRLEEVVGVQNPLDLTPIMDDAAFSEAVAAMLQDPGVDLGVVGCVPLTAALSTLPARPDHTEDLDGPEALVARLLRLRDHVDKPWVTVIDGGPPYDPMVRRLEAGGLVTFRTVDRALRLLGVWADWQLR